MNYTNNSVVLITEIEQTNATSNNGLQCITDRRPCCATPSNRHGEWFFHDNGGVVPTQGGATTFYRNRGDDGTVNLNRLNSDVMMPTGRFCCVVPDATGVDRTICANIGEWYNSLIMKINIKENDTSKKVAQFYKKSFLLSQNQCYLMLFLFNPFKKIIQPLSLYWRPPLVPLSLVRPSPWSVLSVVQVIVQLSSG